MHPILVNDPVPVGQSYHKCQDTGLCGLPVNHPGNHVPDHSISECNASEHCVLCQYRSRRLLLSSLKASNTGCVNCPVCHGAKFVRGSNSKISPDHGKLLLLAIWYQRS
jgi:hypothetical protein